MKYLPVFQELFESDSIIFMLIGLVLSIAVGTSLNNARKNITGLIACLVLYILCELASNIHTNYLLELILLFAGTAAIGGILGFLTSAILANVKSSRPKH